MMKAFRKLMSMPSSPPASDRDDLPEDERTLLEQSERGRDILAALSAQGAQERLVNRRALAAERDEIDEFLLTEARQRQADEAREHAEIDQLHQAWRSASDASLRTAAIYRERVAPRALRKDRVEHELRQTASPLFRHFMDVLERVRTEATAARDAVRERTLDGGTVTVWHNSHEVNARVQATFDARWTLEAWMLEPWTDSELTARFEALLADLPTVPTRPAQYLRGVA